MVESLPQWPSYWSTCLSRYSIDIVFSPNLITLPPHQHTLVSPTQQADAVSPQEEGNFSTNPRRNSTWIIDDKTGQCMLEERCRSIKNDNNSKTLIKTTSLPFPFNFLLQICIEIWLVNGCEGWDVDLVMIPSQSDAHHQKLQKRAVILPARGNSQVLMTLIKFKSFQLKVQEAISVKLVT